MATASRLRSAAAAAAAGRAVRSRVLSRPPPMQPISGYHIHIGRVLNGNRRPRFSPLNRHNHEADALLEQIKETKIGMVTKDTLIKTLRHSVRGCQQILFQNVL